VAEASFDLSCKPYQGKKAQSQPLVSRQPGGRFPCPLIVGASKNMKLLLELSDRIQQEILFSHPV
jgi:hypothetical protein